MNPGTRLFALIVLAWSGWWLHAALLRFAEERRCILMAGPWLPCGTHDWKVPLLMATLPLAAVGCWVTCRLLLSRAHCRLPLGPR
jgi:hypothetical protein